MKQNSLLMAFFSLTLCLSGSVFAQPVNIDSSDNVLYAFTEPDTPTPTPMPMSPLFIDPGQLEVGEPFTLNITLNQDITQPFDFCLFIDTLSGVYMLYLNGGISKGIKPLYRNVPRLDAPCSVTVRSAFNIPASMKGETITFHAAFIQAGKRPITPYIILMAAATAVVQ